MAMTIKKILDEARKHCVFCDRDGCVNTYNPRHCERMAEDSFYEGMTEEQCREAAGEWDNIIIDEKRLRKLIRAIRNDKHLSDLSDYTHDEIEKMQEILSRGRPEIMDIPLSGRAAMLKDVRSWVKERLHCSDEWLSRMTERKVKKTKTGVRIQRVE